MLPVAASVVLGTLVGLLVVEENIIPITVHTAVMVTTINIATTISLFTPRTLRANGTGAPEEYSASVVSVSSESVFSLGMTLFSDFVAFFLLGREHRCFAGGLFPFIAAAFMVLWVSALCFQEQKTVTDLRLQWYQWR